MWKIVAIDCFPESLKAYPSNYAIVVIDVIRATTTAVTCVALGRRCFPIPSLDAVEPLIMRLTHPLLIGEVGGLKPSGFDMNNSPAELEERTDISRPAILLSTSGTRLICKTNNFHTVYIACLRNYQSLISFLAIHYDKVAIIGAGTRGEFREEDQLCCAWIAEGLFKEGFEPLNSETKTIVERWSGAPVDVISQGASAEYLRTSKQIKDLEFIQTHINDLNDIFQFKDSQIRKIPAHSNF